MTVGELIGELSRHPADAEMVFLSEGSMTYDPPMVESGTGGSVFFTVRHEPVCWEDPDVLANPKE